MSEFELIRRVTLRMVLISWGMLFLAAGIHGLWIDVGIEVFNLFWMFVGTVSVLVGLKGGI